MALVRYIEDLVDPGQATPIVDKALEELARTDAVRRIWDQDPALWKPNPDEQDEIVDRLGWLDLPISMQAEVEDVQRFAEAVRESGVRHVVLCGMGGSSLAPEVFRLSCGSAPGYPTLLVLDSTDPGALRAVDAQIDPAHTLFVISSKSGGTIEVMSFLAHFWEATGEQGERFCAITDPGTSLERLAAERGFRKVFLNPPDIGGRYSALSLFGLVPAALIGLDVERLLQRAAAERAQCLPELPVRENSGAWLGAYIGSLAREGRDKLTLLTPPALDSFGLWVEQLIAESTGKEGKGIVPVVGEPLPTDASVYGNDRCFVGLRLAGTVDPAWESLATEIKDHHPLVAALLADPYDLAAEMYRWEFATAVAGALLHINPFDQPNVQESKDNTGRVLKEIGDSARLPGPPMGMQIDAADANEIGAFLQGVRPGDYVAIQAYLTPTPEIEERLQDIRRIIRDRFQVATTLGFGPRFLHSTGQLHKGGPATGIFLQLTYTPAEDLPVPGQPYTFGTLLGAQALGDLESFLQRGLRAARINLGSAVDEGLERLTHAVRM